MNTTDTGGVLRRECRGRSHGIAAMSRNDLLVRLQATEFHIINVSIIPSRGVERTG